MLYTELNERRLFTSFETALRNSEFFINISL